ncbi:DUF5106 domain-containing protein [Polaribacter aestuariivivens]|uniref:DUF5106 domain-containing protein n=1 Tax=Polaribacter aestuariivivens TaxID=2304626 RepID=UPI003F497D82
MKLKTILNTYFFIISFVFCSFITFSQNTIYFDIKESKNDSIRIAYSLGEKTYLEKNNLGKEYIKIKDGKGNFTGNLKQGLYRIVLSSNEIIDFFYDNKDVYISLNKNNPLQTLEFKNSLTNELFYKYINNIKNLKSEAKKIESSTSLDKETKKLKIDALYNENLQYYKELEKKYPKNLAILFLKASMEIEFPEEIKSKSNSEQLTYYRKNYFKNTNFNDTWLIRTNFFLPKVNNYIDKYAPQTLEENKKSIDYVISKATNNKELYKFLVVSLLNKYAKSKLMIAENLYAHIAEKYYVTGKASWASEESLKAILGNYEKMKKSLIGEKLDDFSLQYSFSSNKKLSQLTSDYKILQFRKTSCKQCDLSNLKKTIRKNTQVLDIIIGLSDIERKEILMSNAYKNPQIKKVLIDINQEQQVLENLNVTSSPTIYVIDKNNKIIAKRITIDQSIDFIANYNNK